MKWPQYTHFIKCFLCKINTRKLACILPSNAGLSHSSLPPMATEEVYWSQDNTISNVGLKGWTERRTCLSNCSKWPILNWFFSSLSSGLHWGNLLERPLSWNPRKVTLLGNDLRQITVLSLNLTLLARGLDEEVPKEEWCLREHSRARQIWLQLSVPTAWHLDLSESQLLIM
jgi:hypothetical protein